MEIKSFAVLSQQGPFLTLNEDVVDVDFSSKLFIQSDGYGGSGIGDEVARIATDGVMKNFGKISSDADATLPFFYSQKYLLEGNALINSLLATHQKILKFNEGKKFGERGGASLLALTLSNLHASVVATGNVFLYLMRDGQLNLILKGDCHDANLHLPLSGLGLFDELYYQATEIEMREGDILLSLNSALYSTLNKSDIEDALKQKVDDEKKCLWHLFETSNNKMNQLNQSAMLICF